MLGLKFFSDNLSNINNLLPDFDYAEIYIRPNVDFDKLKKMRKKHSIEFTLHAAHWEDGFDLSIADNEKHNLQLLNIAKQAADVLDSQFIIVHPGRIYDENSKQNMFDFLDKYFDERFIFENCPAVDQTDHNSKYLFATPQEMQTLLIRYKAGLALDYSHAICSANVLKKDPLSFIEDFYNLKPNYFHLTGVQMDSTFDNHQHLGLANNDYSFLKQLPSTYHLTLEVPIDNRKEIRQDLLRVKGIIQNN